MEWSDIACIVFVCVTANHLGLVKAVEEKIGFPLFVVNCCKCFTFWSVLVYCKIHNGWIYSLAISFLSGYCAIWLELLEGYVDTFYMKFYEKIYRNTDNAVAADAERGDTPGTVSELRKEDND